LNKKKIFNDPVYGFISIPHDIIIELIEHPYFQRLRHISQLGLTHLVYPSALHTRFSHALGAMHLMTKALNVLQSKGCDISKEEDEAVTVAILLHDIGHGPYSHALETSIVDGVSHEFISSLIMKRLNESLNNRLELAIKIFNDEYERKFFHQLVSSQMDMDRLDYLARDSFFTGVAEGVIGYDRLLAMLDVVNDQIVIEEKGIYSVEKFLNARRIMYWQVYLHKTVISAETLLVNVLKRAKHVARSGGKLFSTEPLKVFLYEQKSKKDFMDDEDTLEAYTELDDFDIFTSIKSWSKNGDKILSILSKNLLGRNLYKIKVHNQPFEDKVIEEKKEKVVSKLNIDQKDADYFVFVERYQNYAYDQDDQRINILFKNGKVLDITEASDNLSISALSTPVEKYYLCFPKEEDMN